MCNGGSDCVFVCAAGWFRSAVSLPDEHEEKEAALAALLMVRQQQQQQH
jgi:hypothetical protein